jgi:hypothetical protein
MLIPDEPGLVRCDRCKHYVVIDRKHPLFISWDGFHRCETKAGVEMVKLPKMKRRTK